VVEETRVYARRPPCTVQHPCCDRTGHLLLVHEAVQVAGFGAEIAASAAEATDCKLKRLGAPRIPVGYAPVLEAQSRIGVADIVAAAKALRGG